MFKNYIVVRETITCITINLYTEFNGEILVAHEMASFKGSEKNKAENFIRCYKDNGVDVSWINLRVNNS